MQIVCLRRRSRESASREDHEYTEGLPTLNLDLEDLDFGGEKIASLLFTRTVGKQNWLDDSEEFTTRPTMTIQRNREHTISEQAKHFLQ